MQEDHKFRVALGVFNDLPRLEKSLSEFQSFGLDAGRTAVVADPGALDGELEAQFSSCTIDGRIKASNLLIRGHSHDGPVKFIDYPTGATRCLPAEKLLHFDGWITAELSNDLNDHLAGGACVLVAPVTAKLEWRVSNTLLKYSVSRVQLHDLAIPV